MLHALMSGGGDEGEWEAKITFLSVYFTTNCIALAIFPLNAICRGRKHLENLSYDDTHRALLLDTYVVQT